MPPKPLPKLPGAKIQACRFLKTVVHSYLNEFKPLHSAESSWPYLADGLKTLLLRRKGDTVVKKANKIKPDT